MDIITNLERMPDPSKSITAAEPYIACHGGKGENREMAAFVSQSIQSNWASNGLVQR
jgi:hypothetical protein